MSISRILNDVVRVYINKGAGALILLVIYNLKVKVIKQFSGTTMFWHYERAKTLMSCSNQSDADPLKVIWVDPNSIKNCTAPVETGPNPSHLDHIDTFHGHYHFGDVRDGGWDKQSDQFTQLFVYQGINSRIKENKDWEDTHFYQNHKKRIQNGKVSMGCHNIEDLEEKYAKFDHIIEGIRKNGYLTQQDLDNGSPYDEIVVNIGRDGQLLFNGGGRHRLSVAKILNIDEIPVLVRVRHRKWQEIRESIIQSETIDDVSDEIDPYLSHPDLRDLIEDR